MADGPISSFQSLTGSGVAVAADEIPIVDASATRTKRITVSELVGSAPVLTPPGTGASATGLVAQLQRFIFRANYATAGNYATALEALTGQMGVPTIETFGRFVGETWTEDGSNPNFVSNRTIDDATDGSAHGFQDFTVFSKGTGAGSQYNSFYAYAMLSGAKNFAHLRGFQSYIRNESTATTDEMTSYISQPRLYTGSTTTEINHYYVAASLASSGSPTVTTEYGFRIAGGPLLASTTWAIHSTWAASSYLAGALLLANNVAYQSKTSAGAAVNILMLDGSNDLYLGNAGVAGNYYIMKGTRIPNAQYYQGKDNGSTYYNLIGIDASNVLQIGASGISGGITLSHGPTIPNNTYFKGKLAAGTVINLLGIDSSDDCYFGNSGLTGRIYVMRPLFTTASTTSNAGFRIPSGTAPTSPVSGDFWYNGTNLMFRDGTTTRTITWA